jgi:hypothetical protein
VSVMISCSTSDEIDSCIAIHRHELSDEVLFQMSISNALLGRKLDSMLGKFYHGTSFKGVD